MNYATINNGKGKYSNSGLKYCVGNLSWVPCNDEGDFEEEAYILYETNSKSDAENVLKQLDPRGVLEYSIFENN